MSILVEGIKDTIINQRVTQILEAGLGVYNETIRRKPGLSQLQTNHEWQAVDPQVPYGNPETGEYWDGELI